MSATSNLEDKLKISDSENKQTDETEKKQISMKNEKDEKVDDENNVDEDDDGGEDEAMENEEMEQKAMVANKITAKLDTDNMKMDELLKLKVMLNDGSEDFMFSRGPRYSDGRWPVNCHLCRLGNLFTEEILKLHIKGRGHAFKLSKRSPLAKFYAEPFYQSIPKEMEKEKPIKIFPGEIIDEITDEYKDRFITKDEFQVKLPEDKNLIKQLEKEHLHEYNIKLPLLGLCYIYKMMGFQGVTYFCTLCNMKIREEAFKHIAGSEHQYKYINRHFPKLHDRVHDELRQIRGIDVRFSIRNVFRKLYRKIENIKGYRKITICDDTDFFKNRKKFLLKTRFDEHYNEDSIILTRQEVDVLIRKCINGMQFIKPDLISLENPSLGYRTCFEDERNGAQISTNNNRGGYGNNDSGRYNNYNDNSSNLNNYHQVINAEIEDLNQEYRNYDRFPRKHPKYEGELYKYNNFKKDGNDRDKKEFNMPWNTYWKRRLRVLYENDLLKRKQRIKKTFGLRANMRTPSPPRSGGGGGNGNNNGDSWNNRGTMNSMINNNYGGGDNNHGNNYGRGFNNLNNSDYYGNNQQAVAGLRDVMMAMMQSSVQQMQSNIGSGNVRGGGDIGSINFNSGRGNNLNQQNNDTSSPELPPASNEPLGVISVLRLFNALENQLGSLGPQAVQLLSRAVLVEKNNQNPNDLMMEKDFYIFFATAREKLKGQYFANMIGSNLLGAVKKTIQDTSVLMEMFEDYCKRTGKSLPNIDSSNENVGNNSGSNKMKQELSGSSSRGGGNNGNNNWSQSNNNNYGGSNRKRNDDDYQNDYYKSHKNDNRSFANDDFFTNDNKSGSKMGGGGMSSNFGGNYGNGGYNRNQNMTNRNRNDPY